MPTIKIAITLDSDIVKQLDALVAEHRFPDRSRAVQEALRDKLAYLDRLGRLSLKHSQPDLADEGRLTEELPVEAAVRQATAGRIAALHGRLSSKYGRQSDSAALVREDRDR